jgi:Xaa-Pro dipeptidase
MSFFELQSLQEAIQEQKLYGWLLCNYKHRDELSDMILGISKNAVNTRPWYCLLFAQQEPVCIVSALEAHILDSIQGQKILYHSREELCTILSRFAKGSWAFNADLNISAVSTADSGSFLLLQSLGYSLQSSAQLIQRVYSTLDNQQIASHIRAANKLYRIVEDTFAYIKHSWIHNINLYEGHIQELLLQKLHEQGLQTDHAPIVAAGANSGDPHYTCNGSGRRIISGDIIQLDIWAKEQSDTAIYADISQVIQYDSQCGDTEQSIFKALLQARDMAVSFIDTHIRAREAVSGADIDGYVRQLLSHAGYAEGLRHRTGHSIDTRCHGFGANLDSIEFPEYRTIQEGSCFSIEPGLYFNTMGFRTEINVYIQEYCAHISGGPIQTKLICCGD